MTRAEEMAIYYYEPGSKEDKTYIKADRMIGNLVGEGKKRFAIFPFGVRGMLVKKILNERYGITEEFIIDNKLAESSDNSKIISLADFGEKSDEKIIVLLANENGAVFSEIRYQLMQYVEISQIVDVFSASMYFDKNVYYDDFYMKHPRLRALEASSREIYSNQVEGAVAECGVYQGWFSNYISRFFPDRKLYLFDTFNGFDDNDIDDTEEKLSGEFRKVSNLRDTSVEVALSSIGYRANAIVKKGYFPETAVGLEDENFAFVSLDTDLYKPIMAGLEFFYPRLNAGG